VIIDQIPVLIECQRGPQGYPSFGELESPAPMQAMTGTEILKGWVYDVDGVVTLNVYVDGVLDGSLTGTDPNLHVQRDDLVLKYPFYPPSFLQYSGFLYSLDTTKYVDGVHQLVLETVDLSSQHNYWVQRPVVFNNVN
jgi:hypothetical protein